MKSITLKLFVVTTVVLAVFIGGMMWIQSAFFEDYYIKQKKSNVKEAAEYLTQAYAKASEPFGVEMNRTVMEYATANGLTVFYTEKENDTHVGMSTIMDGSYIDFKQEFILEQLQYGTLLYKQNKPAMDSGDIFEYEAEDAYGNLLIRTVSSVVREGQSQRLLNIFASLQPIGEAAEVIRNYYVIFFAVALVLIVGLSMLYSRLISRPLLHIDRVAGRIAKLDFREECTYHSKDELGHLSSTINTLSTNLSSTIARLEASNKKLTTELDNAKKLEQQRKEFMAGVSHELKTPLSVIRGYVEKLRDELPGDNASKQEATSIIISESEKMDRLISGMLELSSLEAGAIKLEKSSISLDRIIRYSLKMKADEIIQKHISVEYISDKELLASCDAFRIEQVLSNLICNAVQYTPNFGYIHIRVTKCNDEILCEIENGEVHIPEDEIINIWNHFYRIEKSRNKAYGGVGLGLSIVKQILELHGSWYGARNTKTGVLFYFALSKY